MADSQENHARPVKGEPYGEPYPLHSVCVDGMVVIGAEGRETLRLLDVAHVAGLGITQVFGPRVTVDARTRMVANGHVWHRMTEGGYDRSAGGYAKVPGETRLVPVRRIGHGLWVTTPTPTPPPTLLPEARPERGAAVRQLAAEIKGKRPPLKRRAGPRAAPPHVMRHVVNALWLLLRRLARKDATVWSTAKATHAAQSLGTIPVMSRTSAAQGRLRILASRVSRPGQLSDHTRTGPLLVERATRKARGIGMSSLGTFVPARDDDNQVVWETAPESTGLIGQGRTLVAHIKADPRRRHGLDRDHVALLWESDYQRVLATQHVDGWRDRARQELDLELLMYAVCFGPREPYEWAKDKRRGAARLHRVRDPFVSSQALALAHRLAHACILLRRLPLPQKPGEIIAVPHARTAFPPHSIGKGAVLR